jgi:hypothetical protein
MKKILAIVMAAGLASGCSTMIPAHPRSQQTRGERVEIQIAHKTETRGLPVLAAAAIPAACNYALKAISSGLKNEITKYMADYSGNVSDDVFYVPGARGLSEAAEEREINVQSITVTRYIQDAKGQEIPAFVLELGLRPSFDQTAFQLVPLRAQMNYAKAKVAAKRWTRPWTYAIQKDDTIDVEVMVDIQGFWIDAEGVSHMEPLAVVSIPVHGLTFGVEKRTFKNDAVSQWFPAVPASTVKDADGSLLYGTGNYVFSARISEYDDAGRRVAKYSELLEKNREDWINRLVKGLK